MKNPFIWFLPLCLLASCQTNSETDSNSQEFEPGTFGYDLQFLRDNDDIILLKDGDAQVIVSPGYQAKVFTSTAAGLNGKSFGWINYEAIRSKAKTPHINAYGGEDRVWLGPEGGQFSVFHAPGSEMVFENWQTPAGIDSEPWTLLTQQDHKALLTKELRLQNHSGSLFEAAITREIQLLPESDLLYSLGIVPDPDLQWVGFKSANTLINTGKENWTEAKGTLCIWILGMFNPSDSCTIVVPFIEGPEKELGPVATTNYFGEVPQDRIKTDNGVIYFKGDGKYRSKIGLSYHRATPLLGSYDPNNKVLTIVKYNKPMVYSSYVNQLWEIQENPFQGDAINSYNDGPLEDGGKLGPFYELESSSPAAFLKPFESITHTHRTFHFVGNESKLDLIAQKTLKVSIKEIKAGLGK